MSAMDSTVPAFRPIHWGIGVLCSRAGTWLLCAVYCVAVAPWTPDLLTPRNLGVALATLLPLMIVACGQTVVLISGGIDLSVTSCIALSSVAGAALMTGHGGPLAESPWATVFGVAAMLGVGMAVGLFNGVCVSLWGMPPFMVTLTTMMLGSGLAVWWTQSRPIYLLPESFLTLGRELYWSLVITVLVAVAMHWLLTRSLFGVRLRAVGHNARTAEVSGVPVKQVIFSAYVLSGLCAATASVLITSELETGSPVHWEHNLLDVVGAAVIGGASLYGGRGHILGTLSGVLLLTLIDNSLNLMNLSHFSIMMAKGGVILIAALLDSLRRQGEEA